VGVGVGSGVGLGSGVGSGVGLGSGVGVAVGDGLGSGVGVGLGPGVGVGAGVGEGAGVGSGVGVKPAGPTGEVVTPGPIGLGTNGAAMGVSPSEARLDEAGAKPAGTPASAGALGIIGATEPAGPTAELAPGCGRGGRTSAEYSRRAPAGPNVNDPKAGWDGGSGRTPKALAAGCITKIARSLRGASENASAISDVRPTKPSWRR